MNWMPQAPNYEVNIPKLSGDARNKPCSCGSGQKAKNCISCGHKIVPVHNLSQVEYEKAVMDLLRERNQEELVQRSIFGYSRKIEGYWRCKGITVEQAVTYLEMLWKEEVKELVDEPKTVWTSPKRRRNRYPLLALNMLAAMAK